MGLQLPTSKPKNSQAVSRKTTLSEADKRTYDQDGVVCLRGVLTPEEIDNLRYGVGQQMRGQHGRYSSYDFEDIQEQVWSDKDRIEVEGADRFDIELLELIMKTDPDARPIRDKVQGEVKGKDKGRFFYDAAGWRFYDEIRDVATDSALPEIVTGLMDTSYTNFWEDTTFVKTPGTGQRTTFHQDWSYFQIDGEKCCIVWVALDPVSRENGAMEYIRGSHKWGKTYAPNVLIAQSIDPTSPYEKTPDIEGHRDEYDILSFDVQPGDVIIHHVMTVHGSGGNTTMDKPRRAISFRYCGDDIRYFDKPGAIEQPYIEHPLNNGDRLTGEDYPLVWGSLPTA
jgi:hypothetical protein